MRTLKSILARETSGQNLIPQIDGLRFVAIAAVVAYHINEYIIAKSPFHRTSASESNLVSSILAEGHVGVQLFFVISGFILGLPFAKHHLKAAPPVSYLAYFVRRLVRLEPPYVIALTVALIGHLVLSKSGFSDVFPQYLASLFYVHYFVYGKGSELIAPAWSLEIEVQFYFLAPLLASVFMIRSASFRRFVITAAVLICGGLQYGVDYPPNSPMHGWTIFSSLHWFFAGFLLADLYVDNRLGRSRHPYCWDAIGSIAWVAIWGVVYMRFHPHVLLPFLILLAYASAFKGVVLKRTLSMPWFYIIGGMCYTIYLYHALIMSFVGRITAKYQLGPTIGIEVVGQGLVISSSILVASTVLFVLFEKPFMSRSLYLRVLGKARPGLGKPLSASAHTDAAKPRK